MEALSRQEYPAILERLPPSTAATKLNERVKKIGKVNLEIADWLQERRKVENAYVAGLRKLVQRPLQEVGNDLGVFDGPWRKIVNSTEETATSHSLLSERIEKDIEGSLRSFATSNREMQGMSTIQGNLNAMAKEVEDAKHNNEKLSKKGGKASSQKVEIAVSKLQTATQQWDAQAPFVFESLQSLDERRLNHLRDVLTQLQTHEADLVETNRITVEQTLTALLEVDTAQEIRNWAQSAVGGKPLIGERKPTRQASIAGTTSESIRTETSHNVPQSPAAASAAADNRSEHSARQGSARQESFRAESIEAKEPKESKLKSRFGTMLSRRRQSVHGGFTREKSPSKGFNPLSFPTRNSASRDARPSPSPRASSNNLRDSPQRDNRLSSLAESPTSVPPLPQPNGSTNGFGSFTSNDGTLSRQNSDKPNGVLSPDLSDVQPPPGPPPSHLKSIEEAPKDSEGFSVPPPSNDPISLAQFEAATENDQPQFKLDIRNEPIKEQDADAQAALSNVANTLRSAQLSPPGRKVGTVRGRRDVRNTMYVPALPESSLGVANPENHIPPSPGVNTGRAAALAALSSSENAPPSASDTTSIRSGHSLTNNAIIKHAEMHEQGINASIVETISATFENGATKTVKISGEIALNQIKSDDDFSTPSTDQKLRINNFPNLEAIGPNRTFIHAASPEKPEEFSVDLSHLTAKPSVAFTYKVHIDDSNPQVEGPLRLRPAWKPQGDKLGLVIEYSLNPAWGSEPIAFTNLVLVATYTGVRATGCQTKPTGTHLKEKSLVYWRLGDVTLGQDWHKVICRFTGSDGTAPEPGQIDARWEVHSGPSTQGSGISISRLTLSKGKEKEESTDPFADDSISGFMNPAGAEKWIELETSRKFVSGKYDAKQV